MVQTVLITGANRGIGLELVRYYVNQGDRVIAVCRGDFSDHDLRLHQLIRPVDLTQASDVARIVQEVGNQSIDILINNAGILRQQTLETMDFEQIQQQFIANAIAPLRVTHSLLGTLKSGSKVIMITSRMGSIADNTSGSQYGYRASKAALNAISASLACDLKPKGIIVGLIHPGHVQTDMTRKTGNISPEVSAARIAGRITGFTPQNSGSFFHADGSVLPW